MRAFFILRAFFLLSTLLSLSSIATADDNVGTVTTPEWAHSLPLAALPDERNDETKYGLAYLLSDRQVRKTEEGYEYVERLAYKVVDRSGLEVAARITSAFDPLSEQLSFNFVRVIRGEESFDRLSDAEITTLRQEEGLSSGLLDGNITAMIQLQDVRVGDVIDYSVSGVVQSRLWPNDYFDAFSVEWAVPIAQLHYRVLFPNHVPLQSHSVSTDVKPILTQDGEWSSLSLHVRDPDPAIYEENLPDDWMTHGLVIVTTMQSWSEVTDWAQPLYTFDEDLPSDFVAKLDEIATRHSSRQDQAVYALRLVQEDVRYLGIEIGLGSHVPRSPNTTLERGYGDCKDKSVLLVSALDYLGIDAVPALASLSSGGMLGDLPPSIGLFDHVIVEIDVDGRKLWVDPTLSHQGGLGENLVGLDYGYVLPIRIGEAQLVEIENPLPVHPSYEVQERFVLPEDPEVGMTLAANYIYRGASADYARLRVVNQGIEDLHRDFLDYYAANYSGLATTKRLSVTDDLDENVVIFSAEYAMDNDTFKQSDYREELPVFASAIQEVLPSQVEADRVAPLRLPYGSHTRHTIRIKKDGYTFRVPESKSKELGGITYGRKFIDDNGAFVLDFKLLVAEEVIDTARIHSVIELADEIAEDTDLVIRLGSAVPNVSKQEELGLSLSAAEESAVTRIDQLIASKDYVEALTDVNQLIAQQDSAASFTGFLQLKKAHLLLHLNRDKAALRQFEGAFERYTPPVADSYFKFMTLLRNQGKHEQLAATLLQMLNTFPDAVGGIRTEWLASYLYDMKEADQNSIANEVQFAVADAVHESNITDTEELEWIFLDVIKALAKQDDVGKAERFLPYIKKPTFFAALLTRKDTSALWEAIEDIAGKDLSTAISSYVAYTYFQTNKAPHDYTKLADHVWALRLAGKHEDASYFVNLFIDNWARIEAVGEKAFWFVNEAAYALSDAGNIDEAMSLMTRLLDFGIEENSPLISMAINRAGMLMHWGEFELALQATVELEALQDEYASDYGRMWIYDVKACSLQQLGRTDEAKAVLRDQILPIADANRAAYTKILLCLGKLDQAAELFIDGLQDEDSQSELILTFSTYEVPAVTPPFLAEMNRRAESLRARNDVREAFDKLGRVIEISSSPSYWGSF